ncbi:hypothetical protein [Streptomyces sp. NPDC088915]|uniref:hypothetical protein n=1 Tax=Streptomyces sp. NPDC088915 TaxID=3365912 RepID=UPI003813A1F8
MEFNEVPASVRSYTHFTDPADATFPAYRVFVYGPHVLPDQKGQVMSRALLRAMLINATKDNCGSMARDELSGGLRYRYPDLPDTFVAHPDPDLRLRECATCGQWVSEHANPNGSACATFTAQPEPGSTGNPLCERCRQPYKHHGRSLTVACADFLPVYEDQRVRQDVKELCAALTEAGVTFRVQHSPWGALQVDSAKGAYTVERVSDRSTALGRPSGCWSALRWEGARYSGLGQATVPQVIALVSGAAPGAGPTA